MADARLAAILSRLTPGGKSGKWPDSKGEHWALCPFHDDRHADNFSVSERGYKCFACDAKGGLSQLAEYLGIDETKPITPKRGRLTTDEARALLHDRGLRNPWLSRAGWVEDEKAQAWRYPVDGGYRYKAFDSGARPKYWAQKGVKNQLYGLQWLNGSAESVWWVGGEPDCLLCWQAGVQAICGFGEGSIPDRSIEQLKAKGVGRIHIALDSDEAGRTGARGIADALFLEGIACSIHELPPELGDKGDLGRLYIWHAKDDAAFVAALRSLPAQAGFRMATAVDLGKAVGEIEWLWQNWIPRGFLTMLAGDPGMGKSAVALRLAQSLIEQDKWPDGSPVDEVGMVLWCDTEASQAILSHRIKAWNLRFPEYILMPGNDPLQEMRIDDPGAFDQLEMMIDHEGITLVVIDSLRGSHRMDENSSDLVNVLSRLAGIARNANIAILVVHHLRKKSVMESSDVTMDRIRGSSAISAMCRVIFCLEPVDFGSSKAIRMKQIKNNLALLPEPMGVNIDESGCSFGESPEEPRTETMTDRAIEFLRLELKGSPRKASQLIEDAELMGISKATLYRAKEKINIIAIRKHGESVTWSFVAKE